MKSHLIPEHVSLPPSYPEKGYFDYSLPRFGAISGHANLANWADYCQAFFYAGTTLYLWNDAPEMKVAFLSACSLVEGQAIFLIGKYGAESGLSPALQSLIGRTGRLRVEEIGSQAADAVSGDHTSQKTALQWDFNYLDSAPDNSLDRVILFGAASHVANWDVFARQIQRVLRNGGKVIVADIALGGHGFHRALHMDAHIEGLIGKVLAGIGVKEEELPNIDADNMTEIFLPILTWSHSVSLEGIFLFHGQKGDSENRFGNDSLRSTPELREFLDVKQFQNSWGFLSEAEKASWGMRVSEISDMIERDQRLKGLSFLGENLVWMWHNNRDITDLMFSHLMARPADKVLVIGELARFLGVMDELQRRIGPTGKIVYLDMTGDEECDFKDWPEKRARYLAIGGGEEWPYDFADGFPDNYFDLIFLPQGVHHCSNWLRDGPRLLRALKSGRQFLALECGIKRPEFLAAREESVLIRLIIDRIFEFVTPSAYDVRPSGPAPTPPEFGHGGRPSHDVSTGHLKEAFGASLADIVSLEWKGWVFFAGYKK